MTHTSEMTSASWGSFWVFVGVPQDTPLACPEFLSAPVTEPEKGGGKGPGKGLEPPPPPRPAPTHPHKPTSPPPLAYPTHPTQPTTSRHISAHFSANPTPISKGRQETSDPNFRVRSFTTGAVNEVCCRSGVWPGHSVKHMAFPYSGGGGLREERIFIAGGENFQGKISPLRKVATPPPREVLAACEFHCEFRCRCIRRHQEITATIQSLPGNIRNHPGPTRKEHHASGLMEVAKITSKRGC